MVVRWKDEGPAPEPAPAKRSKRHERGLTMVPPGKMLKSVAPPTSVELRPEDDTLLDAVADRMADMIGERLALDDWEKHRR